MATDRRLGWWVSIALFAYYLLTLGGHHYSVDGYVTFESAKQLFFRHSFVLDPPVRWGPHVFTVNNFSMGLTFAYLPALALVSPLLYWIPSLQLTPDDPAAAYHRVLYGNQAYLLCSWINPLVTALTGALVFAMARRLGLTRGWAVTAALAYGLASPAAAYARFDFSQPVAGLALTAALWVLLEARSGVGLRPLLVAGVGLCAMIVTRPELIVLIAWIGVWLFIGARARELRAVAPAACVVAVAVIAGAALFFWLNHLRFGDWSQTGRPALARLFRMSWPAISEGVLGLLVSPGRGVLVFFPLAWLAGPGLVRLIRERHPAGSLWSGLIVVALAFYGSYRGWWGGLNWGPRFLLPLLPILSLAAAFWASRPRRGGGQGRTVLFAGLAALGFVVSLNGILFDFGVYYLWPRGTVSLRSTAAMYFQWPASPLVSGWGVLPRTSVDLLLLRLVEVSGVRGANAAVLIASALLGILVWTGCRIREDLR